MLSVNHSFFARKMFHRYKIRKMLVTAIPPFSLNFENFSNRARLAKQNLWILFPGSLGGQPSQAYDDGRQRRNREGEREGGRERAHMCLFMKQETRGRPSREEHESRHRTLSHQNVAKAMRKLEICIRSSSAPYLPCYNDEFTTNGHKLFRPERTARLSQLSRSTRVRLSKFNRKRIFYELTNGFFLFSSTCFTGRSCSRLFGHVSTPVLQPN